MASTKDFNPKAVLVVRKASGLSLGGRRYIQGEPVSDDCVSLRKRQQLYRQNFLCYAHDLDEGVAEAAKARESVATENAEGLEGDGSGNVVQENGLTEMENRADAEADASRQAIADAEAAKAAEADAKAKEEADAAKAAAAEATGDDDKSGEAGSSESAKPDVASKKKRSRKKKS